jgi:glutamate--cysteine ligase catalytic subunit
MNSLTARYVCKNCYLISEPATDSVSPRKGEFPGLLGLVNAYVNSLNVDVATKCDIRRYLNLIKERASGMIAFIVL